MINKTYQTGFQKLISSATNFNDRVFNYYSAFFKLQKSTHPLEIQVEPSSVCNLRCKMCTVSITKNIDKKRFLSPQELSTIIDKFKPQSINLTGMGETLLNPYFAELLKTCSDKKVASSFITNIQLLNQKHLTAIKQYPPSAIVISMESGYPKSYQINRLGAKLNITIQKMEMLTKFIKQNSMSTKVAINVALLDLNLKNINHLKKIIDIASNLNITQVNFQNINKLSPYINKLYRSHKISQKFAKIQKYADKYKVNITLPSTSISSGMCYYPWVYPQITANGEVLPCCIISQFSEYNSIVKKYSFGNILNAPLADIWNSHQAKYFRKNMPQNEICRHCTKYQGIL